MFSDGTLVKSVHYDRFYTTETGEDYQSATIMDEWPNFAHIGGRGVPVAESCRAEQIVYHEPKGTGDRHYCDITFKDGRRTRVFDICQVDFFKVGEELGTER